MFILFILRESVYPLLHMMVRFRCWKIYIFWCIYPRPLRISSVCTMCSDTMTCKIPNPNPRHPPRNGSGSLKILQKRRLKLLTIWRNAWQTWHNTWPFVYDPVTAPEQRPGWCDGIDSFQRKCLWSLSIMKQECAVTASNGMQWAVGVAQAKGRRGSRYRTKSSRAWMNQGHRLLGSSGYYCY